MHRFWLKLKSSITGMDDRAILDECERGEDVAEASYEDALQLELPVDVRRVVQNQYREVMANHDRVKELRNTAA
jgi:uncharacterized protein (TIGR02284 family)